MKVKSLLSLAFLAGLSFNSVNAAEQYIIKDGVLADGIEVLKYKTETAGDAFEAGATAPDGTTAAKITHQVAFQDVRFFSKDGFDLTKNWTLVIEFYYKKGTLSDSLAGQKWAGLDMSLVDDTTGGHYGSDYAFVKFSRDIKFKNPGDEWNTETMYIYAPPANQLAHLMTFGWQRQIKPIATDGSHVVYIKNMKLVGEGNKPFFAEDFNNIVAVYNDASDMENYLISDADGSLTDLVSLSLENVNKQMGGGLPIYCQHNMDGKESKQNVSAIRLWENLGTDGSAYYDCEQLQSLQIKRTALRDGNTYIFIPTAGLKNVKEFECSFLSKWCASMTSEKLKANTGKDSLSLPIGYEFVDAPSDAYNMTPTMFCDTFKIAGSWAAYKAPAVKMDASKMYLALVFKTNPYFSYNVDDIQLVSTGKGEGQSFVGATTGAALVGVTAYSMGTTVPAASVETVLSDAKLSIYPNPSADVVTVNNEGVQSVVVYGLDGAVKASANGNAINVSNLAKGIYIVKAYTAEGVIAGSIIKK